MNRRLFKCVAAGLLIGVLAVAGIRLYQRTSDALAGAFETDSISKTDRPGGRGAVVFLRRSVMVGYSINVFAEDPAAQTPVVSMGLVELEHNLTLKSANWSGDGSLFIAVIETDFGKKAKTTELRGYDFKMHRRLEGPLKPVLAERGGLGKELSSFSNDREIKFPEVQKYLNAPEH